MYNDRWGFDKWAPTYDTDVRDFSRPDQFTFRDYDRVLDRIVEYCGLSGSPGHKVLDIGIGTGNLAARVLSAGCMVTGIDPSLKMREICGRKYPAIPVSAGHFLDIPFPPRSFDIIVSSFAFHHLTAEEKEQSTVIMENVLEPGGCIVIADLMFRNALERRRIEQEYIEAGRPEVPEEYAEEYPGYVDDLEQAFTAAGFAFTAEQLTEAVWLIFGCL